MTNHDFRCKVCGYTERDVRIVGEVARVRLCLKCDAMASEQIFDQAQVTFASRALYGRFHPQAGEVIESYGHKRELMDKYGWEEIGDPVKGNRKRSEEVYDEDGQPEPGSGEGVFADVESKRIDAMEQSGLDIG